MNDRALGPSRPDRFAVSHPGSSPISSAHGLRVTVLGRTKVGPKHFLLATATVALVLLFAADPASAHHVMGKRPETFAQGVLSGLGHPIIGLDHLAAVVAVGCLAALYRIGALLAIGFVLAVIAGAAVHVQGMTFPGVA